MYGSHILIQIQLKLFVQCTSQLIKDLVKNVSLIKILHCKWDYKRLQDCLLQECLEELIV